MNVKNEPVFESELRVIKNGKVTTKERGETNVSQCDHNNKGS